MNNVLELIEESIQHWEKDILEPLLQGRKIIFTYNLDSLVWEDDNTLVPCCSGSCPLCQAYMDSDFSCDKCPYKIQYGNVCGKKGESWYQFYLTPNIETAKAMIEKLKYLLTVHILNEKEKE